MSTLFGHTINFQSIIELAKTGKEKFQIDLVEVDQSKDDIASVAKDINSIAEETDGDGPGEDFFVDGGNCKTILAL